MSGCVTYACFGAGPWVTAHARASEVDSWSPGALALFRDLVPLHELGYLLSVAEGLSLPSRVEAERLAWLGRIASLLGRVPGTPRSFGTEQIENVSRGMRSFLRKLGPHVRSRRRLPVLAAGRAE
jgi:hypothetical protein